MASVGEDNSSNESTNNKLIPSNNLVEQNAVNTADNVDVSKYSVYLGHRVILICHNYIIWVCFIFNSKFSTILENLNS